MNNKKLFFLPVLIFAAWLGGQAFRTPRGPHDGIVRPAGDFYIEAGHNATEIFAYLLDSKMKAIPNDGITCIAVFEFPDKTVGNMDLFPIGKDGFHGAMIDQQYKTCTITFERNGKTVSAEFENEKIVAINPPE